jgi:methyl-accepting chemotaxis protein
MAQFRIRTRLLIVLVGVTGLLGLLRLEGVLRTRAIAGGLTELYDLRLLPIGELKQISDQTMRALVRVPQRVRLGLMPPAEGAAALQDAWAAVDDAWPRYVARADTAEERQLAVALRASLDDARRLSMQVREVVLQEDLSKLDRLVATDLLAAAEKVTEQTTALADLKFDLARRTQERVIGDYRAGLVVSGTLAAIVLAVVILAGLSVVRSISRALGRVTQELHAIAAGEGNLAARVPVHGEDEIAELSKAFNLLMEKLQGLVRRVQDAGIKVASSAAQLAASARQQEATVAQQAAATHQVESAARQIAQTASALAHTMDEVSEASEHAVRVADSGRSDLARMEATIRQVQTAAQTIGDKLGTINTKTTNINGIVTTITKVADQTNLLSLNASIEAARAGELGQGFAVVAREIRRLADQTAVATLDIEQTVKEMQVAVSSGVMSMERFGDEVRTTVEDVTQLGTQLSGVIDEVNVLGPRFIEVGRGMTSQSEGAQQISTAMTELSDSARQTADALRESTRAIAQLNEAARELQREVTRFVGV